MNNIVKNVAYPDWILDDGELWKLVDSLMGADPGVVKNADGFWAVVHKLATYKVP